MKFINLNHHDLEHYDYHWILGLRYHTKPPIPNLLTLLDARLKQKTGIHDLETQQTRLLQRPFLIRFFYQLFNIDDFAFNTYLLATYHVCQSTQKDVKHSMPKVEHQTTKPADVHLEETLDPTTSSPHSKDQGMPLAHDSTIEPENVTTPPPASSPTNNAPSTHVFMVNSHLLLDLVTIGLRSSVGDTLTWARVKQAFRAKVLLVHPDKPKGNAEDFHQLLYAFDHLKALLFNEHDDQGNFKDLNGQWTSYFEDSIKRREQELIIAERDLEALKQSSIRLAIKTKALVIETKALAIETKALAEERKELSIAEKRLEKERGLSREARQTLLVTLEKLRPLYNKRMGRDPSEPWPEKFGIPIGASHVPNPESSALAESSLPELIVSARHIQNFFFSTLEQPASPSTDSEDAPLPYSRSLSID
ncbi:MAG: hypothetical protein NTW94_02270 [Legionellales bacterium]|nr:hypothetical protein [Legionellales bacterium]